MEFVLNELSLEGQFADLRSFHEALARIMRIRQAITGSGSSLLCNSKLAFTRLGPDLMMQQAINGLPEPHRRAVMSWLTKQGPYWEDERVHDPDMWLEAHESIVTDSAVGEVAVAVARGLKRDLVSCVPSAWAFTPVRVTWTRDEGRLEVSVANHWEPATVEASLVANPPPILSWMELELQATRTCSRLAFSKDAFDPLRGVPFGRAVADQIGLRLRTLDQFSKCFDKAGRRNAEGNRLSEDHFTGDNAWFSDSSDDEKNRFEGALTFQHPAIDGQTIFCPWHGKVRPQTIRIHFSWPVRANEPVYVVYVGPKLTKR